MGPVKPALSDRLYAALLRLLPFDFRSEFGGDMEETFRAQRQDALGQAKLAACGKHTLPGPPHRQQNPMQQRFRPRWTSGHIDIHRNHPVHSAERSVVFTENPAADAASPYRDD